MFTLVAGAGKLVPAHPMYKEMEPGFAKLMGPFFGLPGGLLRVVLGLAYLSAGLGLLTGIWGEYLKKFDGDLLALDQALLVCVPIGVITIHLGALFFHLAIEGNPGPPAMFIPMMCLLLYSRLQLTPYETMSEHSQKVIKCFVGVCGAGLVLGCITKCAAGTSTDEIKKTKAGMEPAQE